MFREPFQNYILAQLPRVDYERILPSLTHVSLPIRHVYFATNAPIEFVYFPRNGVASIVVTLSNGAMSEIGVVGAEGVVGALAALGADRSPHRVFCQMPTDCVRMPATVFRNEFRREGVFRNQVERYLQAYVFQVSQSTACNQHHQVEARCARWLLMCQDRARGAPEFPMTHEFLAAMLGVRRPSVTLAVGAFRDAGLIEFRRGRVTILDRLGLEAVSCECHDAVRTFYSEMLV